MDCSRWCMLSVTECRLAAAVRLTTVLLIGSVGDELMSLTRELTHSI